MSRATDQSKGLTLAMVASQSAEELTVLLVVKDQKEMLRVRHLLASAGDIKLFWWPRLLTVMDILRRHRYDVVIWDEHLFTDNQEEFLRNLGQQAKAPVIVMGADGDENKIRQLILQGAADYIAKYELSTDLLIRMIRRTRYRALFARNKRIRGQVDALTGILDRGLFYDRLHQSLLRAKRLKKSIGVIFLNIDGFRRINQRYGYRVGDTLIKMVASRIRQGLRQSDSLARVGGDEFAFIVEDVADDDSLTKIADKLTEAFARSFACKQHDVELSLSMGIASYPEEGKTADQLLQHANQAMFDAKKARATSYRFFDTRRNEALRHRLQLEAELRQAIRGNQLEVYYQPKINIETGDIAGMEALVRWHHPTYGLRYPELFMATAERSGLIVPMGYAVLQKTCEDLAVLQAKGMLNLHCSVNLSFRQFRDPKLTETVFRIIYAANIDTTGFEFELTEPAMMYDQEYTLKCLQEMTRIGLSFSLGDFGTGYSSFGSLRKLPVSSVKIGKSLIENLEYSKEDRTLVAGMISLAHNLSLEVVAEGVETPGQLAFLREHQGDFAQGYLISKPLMFKEFCEFIDNFTQGWELQELS